MKQGLSRRTFLRHSILATSAVALSQFSVAGVKLAKPNERVNLACVGIGNRAAEIIRELYKTGLCNIVALCDVDMGAPHTQGILKDFPNVPRFQDFRQMFDKMANQIDAVSIGVPDFSHFPVTMMAMDLGKHVYVEKPLARTFLENELLMKKAVKFPKVVTQMGNQGHSDANYFQFKAWKDAGIIKDITRIDAHMNNARRWHGWDVNMKNFPDPEHIPDTLDWDLWQMHTIGHYYNKDYINGQWRCWYDFGMGALGDWGAHILDTAHEFLDLGLPNEINPTLEGHNDYFFPMASTLQFRFPKRGDMPSMDITWYDGVNNMPTLPAGYGASELDPNIPIVAGAKLQSAKLNPGKIIYSDDLTFKGGTHGSTLSIIPGKKSNEMASKLPEVPKSPSNHFANFLLSCLGKEKTRSPFEIFGPLSQVFSLGVIAQRLNTPIKFDRDTKMITNNQFANALLTDVSPRKGWEQFYKL